jgi:predicted NBD/HSP70 family sugar kinase
LTRGAARNLTDFVYVKVSHGIGASPVIGGEPYRGGLGLGGQIGHTPISGRVELCRCGRRGCLEAVVCVRNLAAQIAETHPALDLPAAELLAIEDPVTRHLLNAAGLTLGGVLAQVANLLNPTALILGGALGASSPDLLDGVRVSLIRHAQPATSAAVETLPAALGERAELVGGLQYAARLALSS